jgi:hypothetical protein
MMFAKERKQHLISIFLALLIIPITAGIGATQLEIQMRGQTQKNRIILEETSPPSPKGSEVETVLWHPLAKDLDALPSFS